MLFGRVADMLGRKRIYGYEVLVLAAGAIASAFSPNIWWLIGFRVILGIGIGGDYPVSSTIMSEYAGKRTRGMMVTLVFAMQAAGLIVGPLLAAGLLVTRLSHDLDLAPVAGLRRGARDGGVPDAPASGGNAALPARDRPARRVRRGAIADARASQRQGSRARRGSPQLRSRVLSGEASGSLTAKPAPHPARRRQPRLGPDGLRLLRQHGHEPDGARRDQPQTRACCNHTLMQLAIFAIAAAPGLSGRRGDDGPHRPQDRSR